MELFLMIKDMLQLNIQNETASLKAVILGTAKSNGAIPTPEDCYDPKSLQHVLKGTYPKEQDMIFKIFSYSVVFFEYFFSNI